MMILEDSHVIEQDGLLGVGLDVEVVGSEGVFGVMDDGREEKSEDLEVREPVLCYVKMNN